MFKNNILHVSMYYYPVRGGQEVYIDNMNKFVLKNTNVDILQPDNRYTDHFPEFVYRTPNIPLLNRIVHDFHWFVFNAFLFFKYRFFKKYDVVIVHYSFHNKFINAKKKIIISHGVDWRVSKNTLSDQYRKKSALWLKKNINNNMIVANDTNYLKEIGCDVENAKPFYEVEKNIWFIPNCIDTETFQEDPSIKKEKIILCPRNIRWERGIHLAIEAFHEFLKKSNDKSYKLVVLGGPLKGSYYNKCLQLVEKNMLDEYVCFLGSVSSENVKEYYQKAMITVIPTIDQEGTSLSALESMSCGTPVVSTANGGLVDLPTLKSKTDAIDFANKIVELFGQYEQIKHQQQKETRDIFNMKNWTVAWSKVIEKAYI